MPKLALVVFGLGSILVCVSIWAFSLIDLRSGLAIGMVPFVLGPDALFILVWVIWLVASLALRRWRLAVVVLAIPIASAMFFVALQRVGVTAFEVYFLAQRGRYLDEVAAATASGEKSPLLAWAWGDAGGPGTSIFIYTLVYDPSGTILRPPAEWPAPWRSKANLRTGEAFASLLDPQSTAPNRPTLDVEPLGGSFYLAEQVY